ncbi:MAG: twin-arginine translocase TatA/TatE family subunit [Deltaproteobacteria bacterium]|nr:twin-arginine translocase TatA/TatE family subunit [Deltaproteobacteria bacterium]
MGIGVTEWLIILLIVLVLFGGRKLPELMSGLGKGLKNFKKELNRPDEIDVTPESKKLGDSSETDKSQSRPEPRDKA